MLKNKTILTAFTTGLFLSLSLSFPAFSKELPTKQPTSKEKISAIQKARQDIGDYELNGTGCRVSGWVEKPVPLVLID